jgi:hypothetical protein
MRRKLLFAATMLLAGMSSMQAQEWNASTIANGKYYIYNVGSGKYLGAGNSWGTQASLIQHPEYITIAEVGGKYTFESRVSNGSTSHYFNGSYMDNGTAIQLTIEDNGTYYVLTADNTNYYGYDGSTTVLSGTLTDKTSANAQWKIISEADMKSSLSTATVDEPVDATFLILDPNFGRNNRDYEKWTFTASNKNNHGDNTNFCVESWHATFTMKQTIADVPNGVYGLTAQGFYRQDGTDNDNLPYFFINSAKATFPLKTGSENSMTNASVSFTNGLYTIDPIYVKVTEGSIELGAKNEVNTALWCIWDNFVLTYYGDIELSEILFPVYVQQLTEAVDDAKALDMSEATAGAQTALQAVITEYDGKSYSTVEDYEAAIAAVRAGIDAANKSIAAYAAYSATKAFVKGIVAQDVYTDESNAVTDCNAAVAAADEAVAAAATETDINAQAEALKAAVKVFISSVTMNNEAYFDLTGLIANPTFDSNATTGWTYNVAPGYSARGKNAEYYEKTFDFNQTLLNMPKGSYELKVQAFQRPGSNAAAFTAYKAGTDVIDSYIYINEGQTKIKNVMSEYSETALNAADPDYAAWSDYKDTDGHWHPNGMYGASLYFNAGMYENSILTSVEGTLKFGFKGTYAASAWTLFDNFRLYYYGNAISVAISENADFSVVSDVENAKITLTRSFVADKWNTIVLPFDLTDAEAKAAFGNDVKVAEFAENSAEASNATVTFTTAASAAITANTPVLIKTTTSETEFVFTGKTIKAAAEAKVAGTNFSFVGSYKSTATIANGSYFIANDLLWKSEGTTTLKGMRAYIAPNTSGAKIVNFIIDGAVVTGINGMETKTPNSDKVYNLAGQEVKATKATKGLYIVKGKKQIN